MPTARIVPDVVREHAELAAFLWAQRDTLAREDPPDLAVVAGVDQRLEANLDGLRIAGAAAWPFVIGQYEDYPEKGELFLAAVMAIERQDHRRIEQVIAFARNSAGAGEADPTARYWAAWASVELGAGRDAADVLKAAATGGGPEAPAALRALVRAGPAQAVRQWLGSLLDSPRTAAVAVRGAGMLGDRRVLPWLVQQMRKPELAVAAGAAFLELYAEAQGKDDLFSSDPADLGPEFSDYFGDAAPRLPVADIVAEWARASAAAEVGDPERPS